LTISLRPTESFGGAPMAQASRHPTYLNLLVGHLWHRQAATLHIWMYLRSRQYAARSPWDSLRRTNKGRHLKENFLDFTWYITF